MGEWEKGGDIGIGSELKGVRRVRKRGAKCGTDESRLVTGTRGSRDLCESDFSFDLFCVC